MERVRIETGAKAPQAAGGTAWVTTASEIRFAEWVPITAKGRERYQSLDAEIAGEFRFFDWPAITMAGSRFVLVTDGHPRALRIYYPVAPPDEAEGSRRESSVLVLDSGVDADE